MNEAGWSLICSNFDVAAKKPHDIHAPNTMSMNPKMGRKTVLKIVDIIFVLSKRIEWKRPTTRCREVGQVD